MKRGLVLIVMLLFAIVLLVLNINVIHASFKNKASNDQKSGEVIEKNSDHQIEFQTKADSLNKNAQNIYDKN